MGTPDFAVPSLDALNQSPNHTVVGVVTAPDKPAGRGLQLTPSPVKVYATQHNIPVLQPEKLRNAEFLAALQAWQADVFVVVAFRMLPEAVWAMPPRGTFNLHASLLPNYRGAAPINWAVAQGEKESGATTFFLDKEIDTGSVLLQYRVAIPDNWNAGDLHDHLMHAGAALVLQTADAIESGTLQPQPQDEAMAVHRAPKIFKETCQLSFEHPAAQVRNFIRGMAPYPGAWTTLDGKICKLFETAISDVAKPAATAVGEMFSQDGRLYVVCSDGVLEILQLQLEGKKRMAADAFLRGYRIG